MTERAGRRGVFVALLAVTAIAAALRFLRIDAGLPFVFHSDSFQIDQAFELLEFGWFVDSVNYPLPLVHVYAALARLDHALQCLFAWLEGGVAETFASYLDSLRDRQRLHTLGRIFSASCGTLLVPATYLLARARFDRVVALLAATYVAVDPGQLITSLQVRPHVPVALLIAAGAAVVLRSCQPETPIRRPLLAGALLAGSLLGLATACFQLGWFALAWAFAVVLLSVRPIRAGVRRAAEMTIGFAMIYAAVTWYSHRSDLVHESVSATAREAASTLSLPATFLARGSFTRLIEAAISWFSAGPLTCLLVVVVAGAAIATKRGASLRGRVGAYLGFPAIVFVIMGGFIASFARYSLVATPFLAIVAAAGCAAIANRRIGLALAAVWIASGAAASVRFLDLLGATDTRVSANALALDLAERGAVVAIQDRLIVDRTMLSSRLREFPPHDPAQRESLAEFGPRELLARYGATVFLTTEFSSPPMSERDLAAIGFMRVGAIGDAPGRLLSLPDLSERSWFDLFRADRPGPPIEVYARSAASTLFPTSLDPLAPHAGEGIAELRRRIDAHLRSAPREAPAWETFVADVDGDGIAERCAGNVDAATATRMLARPARAWRSSGGSRGGSDAPRLRAHGRVASDESLLVVVSGLSGRIEVGFVVTASVGRDSNVRRVLRLPTGAADSLVLTYSPRSSAPSDLSLELQAFSIDPDGRVCLSDRLSDSE